MSLNQFEEWLETKHPEHSGLMDEFTQDMNVEYEENQKLCNEYLEKYGREENCPNCDIMIFYVLPNSWGIPRLYDMTEPDSFLSVPCLHCPTILTIKNSHGKLENEFFPQSSTPKVNSSE